MVAEAIFLDIGSGSQRRRVAVIAEPGDPPTLVWLGGFKSEMAATKAAALADWARGEGRAMLRFDYSGHGQSGGDFETGTISRWLEETETAVERFAPGPLILVGSSMGGWISLLSSRRLIEGGAADRLRGMVLIAPAVDMTTRLLLPGMTDAEREALRRDGRVLRPSRYGDEPYVYTRALIEDGERHLLGDGPIALPCPVRILHGQRDPDVPWRMSLDLAERLDAPSVRLTLVEEGDHRLSRPQDIELLISTVAAL